MNKDKIAKKINIMLDKCISKNEIMKDKMIHAIIENY